MLTPPPGLKVLGFVTYDDPETSLWRPFGAIRIEHVRADDTLAGLQARKIQYVLLNENKLKSWFHTDLAGWQKNMGAEIAAKIALHLRASAEPSEWVLLKLPASKPDSPSTR